MDVDDSFIMSSRDFMQAMLSGALKVHALDRNQVHSSRCDFLNHLREHTLLCQRDPFLRQCTVPQPSFKA